MDVRKRVEWLGEEHNAKQVKIAHYSERASSLASDALELKVVS